MLGVSTRALHLTISPPRAVARVDLDWVLTLQREGRHALHLTTPADLDDVLILTPPPTWGEHLCVVVVEVDIARGRVHVVPAT